jgi:signal transduction histidine kinase
MAAQAPLPVNLDFADEVKIDRLRILWKATLAVCLIVSWLILTLVAVQRGSIIEPILPFLFLVIGCLITRSLLNRNHYTEAAWVYALGAMVAVGTILITGNPTIQQIAPFAFPVIVFMVGLLLPPMHTVVAAIVASALVIFVPALAGGWDFGFFSVYHAAAIVLTFLSAILAIQVTGDLFQITEWALSNYQRERRTAGELFDNRQQLERTLHRSEALSENLKETNAALDNAKKAAEEAKHYRGQFLANMSHELRTPLNAIIGFSETMLKFPAMYDGVKLPNAYEGDLSQIYSSGRQLLTLINDILDLSKVDAGKLEVKMERVELMPAIHSVMSTAGGLVGNKPVTLLAELPDHIPPVYADRARVNQVMLNLYSNAAKFTDSGSITIRVREVDDGVEVSLTDTGGGIAKENLELIFEEFKQAETGKRDPRAGAGLGLAISRQLMTLMGGKIWAESEFGKGSTFHFIVQRFPEPVIEPTLTPVGDNRSDDNTAAIPMVAAAAPEPVASNAVLVAN